MAGDLIDPRRTEPSMVLDEDRRMLEEWLDFQRTTLLLKVEGLDDEQRRARPVPTSLLSLHGLVRHLTEVERWWFERVLEKDPSKGSLWDTEDRPEGTWVPLDDAVWDDDLAGWQAGCETSREIAARHELTDLGDHPHEGPVTLRWIYVHMIEEYARHNGHADLVRELVDGEVRVLMVDDLQTDRREEPPKTLPDREMLERWLEFHRTTLLLKCEGLDDEQRKARPIATSLLSLHGLLRHMAEVERNWFQRVMEQDDSYGPIWFDEDVDDSELVPLDDAVWEDDVAQWEEECERNRRTAASHDLDDTGFRKRTSEITSLRWIYVHMIEEYARHNGHADLIRELVDGEVGW